MLPQGLSLMMVVLIKGLLMVAVVVIVALMVVVVLTHSLDFPSHPYHPNHCLQ